VRHQLRHDLPQRMPPRNHLAWPVGAQHQQAQALRCWVKPPGVRLVGPCLGPSLGVAPAQDGERHSAVPWELYEVVCVRMSDRAVRITIVWQGACNGKPFLVANTGGCRVNLEANRNGNCPGG
jgi:hypothetical protein